MLASQTALLLIAHGSRRQAANEDLLYLAEQLRATGRYARIQTAYLELSPPSIGEGGAMCVQAGIRRVILVPYFLSPGVHVTEDLTEAQAELQKQFPEVEFRLAEPLGRHPLLAEIVAQRVQEAER